MKKIYLSMWKLAKPYYLKGRPMDVMHITWMMKEAEAVAKKESLDESILLPLVILHDVGYANVPKDNPYKLDMRRAHMCEGKKIALEILEKLEYPIKNIKAISQFVSIHDNWAFGDWDFYKKSRELGAFNDLDFIWMATEKGFPAMMRLLGKDRKETFRFIIDAAKEKTFFTKSGKKLYKDCLDARKKEILGKNL